MISRLTKSELLCDRLVLARWRRLLRRPRDIRWGSVEDHQGVRLATFLSEPFRAVWFLCTTALHKISFLILLRQGQEIDF
jgi:hypothetical protein